MRDIRRSIDEEVDAVAPFTVDIDRLIQKERRRSRRLGLTAGGGTAMAMVAVVGIGVALFQPDDGGPPAARDENTGPTIATIDDMPPLEDDVVYGWTTHDSSGGDVGDDDAYTEAFFSYFEENWPEAEIDTTEYFLAGEPELELAAPPAISWQTYGLFDEADMELEPVFERTGLQLSMALLDKDDPAMLGSHPRGVQYDFGDGWVNLVSVEVLPASSFTVGDGGMYDALRCGGIYAFDPGGRVNSCVLVDQGELTTEEGNVVHHAVAEETNAESGLLTDIEVKVLLVRADGSAVLVSDLVQGPHPGQNNTTVEGAEPPLSVDDLLGIAEALPGEFP